LEFSINEKADYLIVDTAGRLQNKTGLMDELSKICRVISKLNANAPHHKIVVLDGTVGQNAHSQVKNFNEQIQLTGMIITKLDGSAKGGVIVSLAEQFKLPIFAVGVGEKVDDLDIFKADDYSKALLNLE
jgi:fused signal recognition particle receptor